MFAIKFIKNIVLIAVFSSGTSVFADSGSWVGNSPVNVAKYNPIVYARTFSDSSEEQESWNSLLLPKGMSRFSTQFTQFDFSDRRDYLHVDLSFDYAFTEKLTTFSLTQWGYSLLSGNGQGHELAAYFGLNGFGYSTVGGWTVVPGVGLGYAYSLGPWRFVTRLLAYTYYYERETYPNDLELNWNSQVTRSLGESWWAGIGVDSLYPNKETDRLASAAGRPGAFLSPRVMVGYSSKSNNIKESSFDIWTTVAEKESSLGVSWRW